MIEVIPAILAKDNRDLSLKLKEIPTEIELVHIDVLENDIWTETDKDFEVHLMVKDPSEIMERWINRGAKRIAVHEINEKILSFKDRVELGLAVELTAPLEKILPLVSEVSFLHLMSIEKIGAQGHPFDERIFDRIKLVREKFPNLILSVDGGVGVKNFEKLKDLGVNRFVVGSGFKDLWKSLTKK